MMTKAYHWFKQRCDYHKGGLELCELLVARFQAMPDGADSVAVSLGGNAEDHPHLHRRSNTAASRGVVGGHMRKSFHGSFFKEIHEDFSEYVSTTMRRAALKGVDPKRFVGEARTTYDGGTILSLGSWDAVVERVSNDLFRRLENERSTARLIEQFTARLGLVVPRPVVETALPYFEIRHVLVHRDGLPDAEFRSRHPSVPIGKDRRIALSRDLAERANASVLALASAIDAEVLSKGMVRDGDTCP